MILVLVSAWVLSPVASTSATASGPEYACFSIVTTLCPGGCPSGTLCALEAAPDPGPSECCIYQTPAAICIPQEDCDSNGHNCLSFCS